MSCDGSNCYHKLRSGLGGVWVDEKGGGGPYTASIEFSEGEPAGRATADTPYDALMTLVARFRTMVAEIEGLALNHRKKETGK